MTAIKPSDSVLRDQIDADGYNSTLNVINAKYTEMDKYIGNLESDVMSIKDFEKDVLSDQARGYDVGTSLDTLGFQKDSLQIDLDFFKHMKDVYIKKLYGDLYKYCDSIIESALAIEEIPTNSTRDKVKERKFRNMTPYPPNMIPNPSATDSEGNEIADVPKEIIDPFVKYDMNEIFALINCTTSNLRELAEDIGSFEDKINSLQDKLQKLEEEKRSVEVTVRKKDKDISQLKDLIRAEAQKTEIKMKDLEKQLFEAKSKHSEISSLHNKNSSVSIYVKNSQNLHRKL